MNNNPCKSEDSWRAIKEISAETTLQERFSKSGQRNKDNLNFKYSKRKKLDKSVFVTQKANIVGGGTNAILNALAGYLRYLEGTARDDWQEYVVNIYQIHSDYVLGYLQGLHTPKLDFILK